MGWPIQSTTYRANGALLYLLSYGTLGNRKVFSARAGIENFCSYEDHPAQSESLKSTINDALHCLAALLIMAAWLRAIFQYP